MTLCFVIDVCTGLFTGFASYTGQLIPTCWRGARGTKTSILDGTWAGECCFTHRGGAPSCNDVEKVPGFQSLGQQHHVRET
jgi:hypothetical protein